MPPSTTIPGFILSGGSAGKGAGLNNPGQLEQIYGNLLSGAAGIVQGLHTKVLDLDAGAIGSAGSTQIGQTETAAEVADNLRILGSIAAFCTANGITVQVDADLTWYPTNADGTNALVTQWATAAAAVGLPITSIQDVEEIGISQQPTSFANYAKVEVNAVQTVINEYAGSTYKMTASNLAVGDMEGGGASSMTVISQWWNAYDLAAKSAGVHGFSYVTADVGWFAPWIDPLSTPRNDGYLEALSTLAASQQMALNVAVEGSQTDTSAGQYVIQSEQNAIHLAELQASGSVNVDNVLVRSWDVLPVGIGEISSPISMVNVAAELEAVYPLYQTGSITAQGSFSIIAPGQIVINTGVVKPIPLLSAQWNGADIRAGNRLGVVIVDQTGILRATQYGSGTVFNQANNILVLSGDTADLAAELSSITLNETSSGHDTIDIETYGTAGRLSDTQITVLATASGQSVATINATSNQQGWLSSSNLLNTGTVIASGSVLTSETLNWSTDGKPASTITGVTTTGESAFVKIDAIHEPLAEYGVQNAPGTLLGTVKNQVASVYDPQMDNPAFPGGGYANNSGVNEVSFAPIPNWLGSSFNAVLELTSLIVQSTTNTFNSTTGQLETSVDRLAPDPLTVVDLTGTHSNMFATAFNNGGTQVTEFNTGANPAWQAGWGNQFAAVTLTYDGSGHLVEALLQGGQNNPLFSIDDVFDPDSGRLWEQFQSTTPPPEALGTTDYATTNNPYYDGFATGPVYVTQFEGSPNWDYVDWGTATSADTEIWVDNFIINNFASFAVNFPGQYSGALNAYPYQFVNGPALDLLYLPGTIAVNLNALGKVVIDSQTMVSGLSGLTEIDAAGATGTVTITGLSIGGSTLIGGDNTSTINGYGRDTIVAGAGITTINTGSGASAILVSNSSGNVTVFGNDDVVNAISGAAVRVTGRGETVNGSNVMISVGSGSSITVNGTNDTINLVGSGITLNSPGNNLILVSDTAADVAANLDALQVLAAGGKLASITFTDGGMPTLALSAAQITADAKALATVNSPYHLSPIITPTPVPDPSPIITPTPVPDPSPIITPTPAPTIDSPLQSNFICDDRTTGSSSNVAGSAYNGPVIGIQNQYVNITTDNLNITATTPGFFIHTGAGNDAINASQVGGVAVLDGGTGSNFLVGGRGNTTFFVDDRNAPGAIWSTISSLHTGDAATVWGVSPKDFNLQWVDNAGAAGYTGLTLHATSTGGGNVASVTLAGYSTVDLQNGRLSVSFGTTADLPNLPGSQYLNISLAESGFTWVERSTRRPTAVQPEEVPAKPRMHAPRSDRRLKSYSPEELSRIHQHLLSKPTPLEDQGILEMVLRVALARRETRPIARALLTKYQTFAGTIAAPPLELLAVRGLGKKGVAALKLIQASVVDVLGKEEK
jgi:hypothetical protein